MTVQARSDEVAAPGLVAPAFAAGCLAPLAGQSPYVLCLRRDAAFHAFVAAYALAGLLACIAAGVPHKFVPLSYLAVLGRSLPEVLLFLAAGAGLWSLRAPSPLRALRDALGRVPGPETLAGLLLFASLSIHMGVFTSVKTMLTDVNPFFADRFLAQLDALLHGRDPWLYAQVLMRPEITHALESVYFGAWGVLLTGALLAVLLAPALRQVRAQYVWTVLLAWPLLGNLVACAVMSAGPVYYELVTGDARFAALVDYLARNSLAQEWQHYLWNSHVAGAAGAGSGVSAFPSLHLANATLFVLLARRIHRWLAWMAVLFCALILFGSVHLGWHYAVDGYFSIAATVLIWIAVGWALKHKALALAGRA